MQRYALALLALMSVSLIVGCSGGEEETPPPSKPAPATNPAGTANKPDAPPMETHGEMLPPPPKLGG